MKKESKLVAVILCLCTVFALTSCDGPEDVLEVFPHVSCHRLLLNAKARLNEVDTLRVVTDIANSVPIPQRVQSNPLR